MSKKIIFSLIGVLILVIIGGGVFWWWNQKDVRELNRNLPKGVKVVKSLFGKEYKVVNKIDGYEFGAPKEWEGIEQIEYIPKREEMGYVGASLNLRGKKGFGRVVGIDQFTSGGDMGGDLESWVKLQSIKFGLGGEFNIDRIKNFEIVKTQEKTHLGGEYTYFFRKDKVIYAITSPLEKFINEIILNGKW